MPRPLACYAPLIVNYDEEAYNRAEIEARGCRNRAVAAINARETEALIPLACDASPYLVRVRAAIRRDAQAARHVAWERYKQAIEEILSTGEQSEETFAVWGCLMGIAPETQLQAAE